MSDDIFSLIVSEGIKVLVKKGVELAFEKGEKYLDSKKCASEITEEIFTWDDLPDDVKEVFRRRGCFPKK